MIISDFCINDSYEQRKIAGFPTGKAVLPVATEVRLSLTFRCHFNAFP